MAEEGLTASESNTTEENVATQTVGVRHWGSLHDDAPGTEFPHSAQEDGMDRPAGSPDNPRGQILSTPVR